MAEKSPVSEMATSSETRPQSKRRVRPAHFLTFFILFGIWILLSGRFDTFHLILGVISCLIVTALSAELLFPEPDLVRLPLLWFRFLRYIPWMLYQVLLANLHLTYLTLHPRLMELIDPHIIEFQTRLKSDLARVTFANSITLTPGTITVNVSPLGHFTVHVIDRSSAMALPGEMEKNVGRIYSE